mmetsp:Transcript_108218/g.304950  ORF Transcript_108218/g.304950 Transcript_108218/m.304950 type:complete len:378 (+) Transcript_108218:125-1258(+)|eukprot:CAMPEP_0117569982 /NCGR_PEP_ID=MMETSP0784-20121206/58950_1 /TAXON_ID=39447 /ORGANISM="" /LENGTH=377 /DNA_ID=CAMNT_0005367995 /DNA_START=104 /DNA_END=1237 /DNA_ORIENTATION=-
MAWCTIESDPGVFTTLCEEIGVKGIQFEEVYTLEPESFAMLDAKKTYGLIFLFKWQQQADPRPTVDAADHGIFFAQQVIENACATQAILSALMNVPAEKLDIGPHLKEFKEFTGQLDPQMKGLAIENSEVIRKAHNSFRHQSSFEIVQEKDAKGDDAFHFVGYICHEGKVYELDGLKKGPVLIGDVPAGTSWLEPVREEIQRRIQEYSQKAATSGEAAGGSVELRFNLMSIVANRLMDAEKAIMRERYIRQRANVSLVSRGEDIVLEGDDPDDDDAPGDIPSFEDLSERSVDDVKALVAKCAAKITEMGTVVEAEKKRREKWAKENSLRRTDLVPLALCAMRHLARTKQLVPAFEKGKAAHLKRVEDNKEAKAAAAH